MGSNPTPAAQPRGNPHGEPFLTAKGVCFFFRSRPLVRDAVWRALGAHSVAARRLASAFAKAFEHMLMIAGPLLHRRPRSANRGIKNVSIRFTARSADSCE